MKISKVTGFQSIGKFIIQTIEETLVLLLVSVHIIGNIVGKLCEMSDILTHRHGSLLQILELLLELDYTLGYVMRLESHLQLILVDPVGFFMSFYICIQPISSGAHTLVRGQQNLLPEVALHNLKLLLYHLEPVIGVHGFHVVRKGWRLGPLEYSKFVSMLRLCCMLVLLQVGHCLLHGWSIWACITRTCSKVGGGGGFPTLLFLVLALRSLVLTI
jgi:hypothetical protein